MNYTKGTAHIFQPSPNSSDNHDMGHTSIGIVNTNQLVLHDGTNWVAISLDTRPLIQRIIGCLENADSVVIEDLDIMYLPDPDRNNEGYELSLDGVLAFIDRDDAWNLVDLLANAWNQLPSNSRYPNPVPITQEAITAIKMNIVALRNEHEIHKG